MVSLHEQFGIGENKITVHPFGINNVHPNSDLEPAAARKILSLEDRHKVLLFFGNIAAYKGLDNLVLAFARLKEKDDDFRLIIAGRVNKDYQAAWDGINQKISELGLDKNIIMKNGFIPDDEIEVYFKAADVSILPYRYIFQSGVLILSYSFGLPVIATDVGSLREDIVESKTGMICRPQDIGDLTEKIASYFQSDLYRDLGTNRAEIMRYAAKRYSWDEIGAKTREVYETLFK